MPGAPSVWHLCVGRVPEPFCPLVEAAGGCEGELTEATRGWLGDGRGWLEAGRGGSGLAGARGRPVFRVAAHPWLA